MSRMRMHTGKVRRGLVGSMVIALAAVVGLAGCSGGNNEPAKDELFKVTQVTNWVAQPEHGGNYTALAKGFYKEAGLDMTITSGGPGVSAAALIASGKAQFGMGSTDEILISRSNGIPVVAVAGIFQKSPQALLFRKGQDIKGFEDLNGRKVFVGSGAGYWEFIKKKYKLDKVTEMKYNFELSSFMADETSVVQSYITSEPYDLKLQGIESEYLLNADSGFAPYGNLAYTTEKMIKEHPEQVRAFVEATIKGWEYYLDNYKEINPIIKERNPDTPEAKMEFGAVAIKPLITGGDAEAGGIGIMTTERWEAMNEQLVEVGVLKEKQDVSKAFTTEFLPKK
ncbi:ABC transporter substrate-binding protein [Paenibacillus sp. GCM10023252]|uniref:ABC transporter substrate-binding protein n=1 Tax=Paenibacillus sp. GCM10023252 TaxID=3252649 RepID=UPI00360BB75D